MHTNFPSWQVALSNAITDPQELLEVLDLDLNLLPAAQQAAQLFPLRVPRGFVQRMQKGDLHDPLLQQILPIGAELAIVSGFSTDPLQERAANPIPGLLHKYQGRVLLTVTGACAINCRYCFRRDFPYAENNPGTQGWEHALAYIAADSSIQEVILSGGDPLSAPDVLLAKLVTKIAAIEHVTTLRVHSRLPIVLPERITPELVAILTATRLNAVLVLHCNHPQEISSEVVLAVQVLRQAGVMVLNQAVLLKEVNDSVVVLKSLSEKLFAMGVLPYYLHLLDKVQGSAHFEVDADTASQLVWGLMQRLPGYLVPRLVCEQSGAPAKLPISVLDRVCYN